MVHKLWLSILFILQWDYCIPETTPKTINLSDKGLGREKFFMELQHEINMHDVTELILRGNKFDSFVDCATKLVSLKILDLSYNNLRQFFFLCHEEYDLLSLNVSHNQIEFIDEKALTHRVIKLKTLDVSYNNLYIVNETTLQHMKNLEFLSIASNPIGENLEECVFENLTMLKHLDLRNISSGFFPPNLFGPLTSLEHLDLSMNPIEEIPPLPSSIKVLYACGTQIVRLGALMMPQLRVLSIDSSPNLTSVLLNNLENLTQLEILSMRDSPRLAEVHCKPTSVVLLPKLKQLSLSNCSLQSLDPSLLPIVQKTAMISLRDNPWRCDCHMKWINAMKLSAELLNSFVCQSPLHFKNRLLHNITNDDLVCEDAVQASSFSFDGFSRILYPFIWICLVLIVVVLFISAFVYYFRGSFGQWARKLRHRGADTVSYTNVVNENNDLVRILPVGEINDHTEI